MAEGVSVVVFEGSAPGSPVEEMMARVRRAALLDNLDKLKSVPLVKETYLITNDPVLAAEARAAGALVLLNDIPPASFHFGRALQELLAGYGLKKVFYFGGAGCPLITIAEIESICRLLLERDLLLYTNNTQSADIVAFTVSGNLDGAALPAADNGLAWALRDHFGLEQELMPQTPGLLFDLDTPADLLVLGASPFAGPRTRAALNSYALDYTRLERIKAALRGYYEDILLIGRVSGSVMEYLNSTLKVRLRVFSEERGMKALGRIEAGEVVSLLGLLLEHSGVSRFFAYLPRLCRSAFIDSRVLMAHYGFALSERERFLSDLGLWEQIEHPWLREFTRAACDCAVPVLLGGHSLVSGSLWLLAAELAAGR